MNSDIEHIKQMLSKHHRNKSDILAESIAKRLDKSLLTYDDELSKGVKYIQNKSELTVLKKL